jgi:hypothetical protein
MRVHGREMWVMAVAGGLVGTVEAFQQTFRALAFKRGSTKWYDGCGCCGQFVQGDP